MGLGRDHGLTGFLHIIYLRNIVRFRPGVKGGGKVEGWLAISYRLNKMDRTHGCHASNCASIAVMHRYLFRSFHDQGG